MSRKLDCADDVNHVVYSTDTILADAQYHHLAFIWRASDGTLHVYLDGAEVEV